MDSGGGWAVRGLAAAVLLAVGLLSARPALSVAAVSKTGTAGEEALTGDWINDFGLVGDSGRVALQDDHAVGFGKLEVAIAGLQNNRPKLTLTAVKGLLFGEQKTLRSVTVRARRGADTVCGKVRVYRDEDDNEVIEFALYKEGDTPTFENVSASIDGTKDLVLVWDNGDAKTATLSFGGIDYSPTLTGLADADVDLCRVELQGNLYLGPIPSIESLDAEYAESP